MPMQFDYSVEQLPLITVLAVFIILITSILIAFRYNPDQYPHTRLSVFFSTLASVAIFLVGINIVLTSISFQYNEHYVRVSQTKAATDKLWLYPNKLIADSPNIRPEFLAGFHRSNIELYQKVKSQKKETPLTMKAIVEEQYIALLIFQSWEDFLTQRRFDDTETYEWINCFLSWAQNPYLRHYFESLKFQYSDVNIAFGELLFEYAKKIPVPTTNVDDYRSTTEQLLRDPRFIKVLASEV